MGVGKQGNGGAGRYSRLGVAKPAVDKATWEDSDPDKLWKTIIAATNAGDALTFAKTRDGGAVVLVIMSGDDRQKHYATGETELNTLLDEIRAIAEDAE